MNTCDGFLYFVTVSMKYVDVELQSYPFITLLQRYKQKNVIANPHKWFHGKMYVLFTWLTIKWYFSTHFVKKNKVWDKSVEIFPNCDLMNCIIGDAYIHGMSQCRRICTDILRVDTSSLLPWPRTYIFFYT